MTVNLRILLGFFNSLKLFRIWTGVHAVDADRPGPVHRGDSGCAGLLALGASVLLPVGLQASLWCQQSAGGEPGGPPAARRESGGGRLRDVVFLSEAGATRRWAWWRYRAL